MLGLSLAAIVTVVCAAATWPAWRAARRPPAEILRGGDLAAPPRARAAASPAPGRRAPARPALGAGLMATGARFVLAARARYAATVATIAMCAGVVLLMLALAALLERLRDDPGTIGKRYDLTVRLDPSQAGAVRRIPGVGAVGVRYQTDVADSFRLGQPLRVIAYPGDHTRFEAPPLADGRRLRTDGEAEVGVGLADALGLRPGATLAAQTQYGNEVRFRVSGIVRALEHDGRVAYVRPARLLAADPGVRATLSVALASGADRAAVERRLAEYGAPPQPVERRDDPQRRLPRRARRRAARRRPGGGARLPLRAGAGARHDGARAPRRGGAAARVRRRRRVGRHGAGRRRARRRRPGRAGRRGARMAAARRRSSRGSRRRSRRWRSRRRPARCCSSPAGCWRSPPRPRPWWRGGRCASR